MGRNYQNTKGDKSMTNPPEPFPDALLVALRGLARDAHTTPDDSRQPAPKRRRVDHGTFDPIPVLQEVFTVSRPARSVPHVAGRITCRDAGRYLKFHWDAGALMIASKPNAPCDAFQYLIDPGQDLSPTTHAALAVLEHSRESATQEGSLTVLATISLDESNAMHHIYFTLEVNMNTAMYTLRNAKQRGLSQHIMNVLGENEPNRPFTHPKITANEFYKATFTPSRTSCNGLNTIPIPGLGTTLYPFQCRAVQWLWMREQVKYHSTTLDGELQLVAHPKPSEHILPFSFRIAQDVNGQQYYVSHLYHLVTRNITPFRETENSLRGGILAEEMGLGKTVEIISLILTHKRGSHHLVETGASVSGGLRPTGATLIVTPDALQKQWLSEFKRLAPQLVVLQYPGMKIWAKDKELIGEQSGEGLMDRLISKLAQCDVVMTTYSVLQAELYYAVAPPERSMRYEKKHERHTSPLVQISWWRLCLDEAQQIDSGVSGAAKAARLIPRVNAWAVTGTPIKDDPNDLWGLLSFLCYEPFASYQVVWKELLKTHIDLFGLLFNKIAMRHSKQAVRDELKLPSQKRYVLTMPFTAIEEHHYRSQFKALITKAGLNEDGTPISPEWDPDDPSVVDYMKRALASLRQMILHPELGLGARIAVYKTLTEHLETMIEHSEACISSHQRSRLIVKLKRGQLLEDSPRIGEALKIWEEVLEEVEPDVVAARRCLREALEDAQRERVGSMRDLEPEDTAEEEILEAPTVSECRRKLRLLLDLHHRVTFLIASAFFQIKSDENLTKPGSDEFKRLDAQEVERYELARTIRIETLREPLHKASKLIDKLKARASTQSFVNIPEIVSFNSPSKESDQVAADIEKLGLILNRQAEVISTWRKRLIQLLLEPLVDTGEREAICGEEYQASTEVQDHLMVYALALSSIVADRNEALNGLANDLAHHELSVAENMAKEGKGHAPEKLLELLQVRDDNRLISPAETNLRAMLAELREIVTNLRYNGSAGGARGGGKLETITTQLRDTQDMFRKQVKAVGELEKELEYFNSVLNARVAFYRQLQSVSDNVAPLDLRLIENLDISWNNYLAQEADLERQTEQWRSNRRRLIHMRETEPSSNDPCPICCSDNFLMGAITTCGHTFCQSCIMQWLRVKHICPACKRYQTTAMLNEFMNRKEGQVRGESSSPRLSGAPTAGWEIYSDVPDKIKQSILDIELRGPSYSTKVDTLIKHLLWLREEDPGTKSIVFTQFRGSFGVLEQALTEHRIGFATFTRSGKASLGMQRFKDDPSIECLLMDAKAHSSGLNLVNASHVFLCEPLLNTALELQATARVDRIGQKRETTVWLYIVEGTVEENVHTLSERRRLVHMSGDRSKGKSKAITEEEVAAASSQEFQESNLTRLMNAGENVGELVDKGDLWECLFGCSDSV